MAIGKARSSDAAGAPATFMGFIPMMLWHCVAPTNRDISIEASVYISDWRQKAFLKVIGFPVVNRANRYDYLPVLRQKPDVQGVSSTCVPEEGLAVGACQTTMFMTPFQLLLI